MSMWCDQCWEIGPLINAIIQEITGDKDIITTLASQGRH